MSLWRCERRSFRAATRSGTDSRRHLLHFGGKPSSLADKVTTAHGDRHPELAAVREVLGELRAELEPHLTREEQVLFPLIRHLASADRTRPGAAASGAANTGRSDSAITTRVTPCGGSVRNPISVMLREHDRAGDLLDRLRMLTAGYAPPGDGCASYVAYYRALTDLEADTHLHVHKENNLLFPAVVALETQTQQG